MEMRDEEFAGIPSVLMYQEYGGICLDDYFQQEEANIACRELGYKGASNYSPSNGEKKFTLINDPGSC